MVRAKRLGSDRRLLLHDDTDAQDATGLSKICVLEEALRRYGAVSIEPSDWMPNFKEWMDGLDPPSICMETLRIRRVRHVGFELRGEYRVSSECVEMACAHIAPLTCCSVPHTLVTAGLLLWQAWKHMGQLGLLHARQQRVSTDIVKALLGWDDETSVLEHVSGHA